MNDNLKWLLLIPVVIIVVALGYLIPKYVGGDDDQPEDRQPQNQALQLDIDEIQNRIAAYEGLVERNPGDVEALKGLGDSYLEMGNVQQENDQPNEALRSYKSAVDNYKKYLAIVPGGVEARIDLGLTYSSLLMPEIAVRELERATQEAPTNQRAWHVLGYVLENNLGFTEQAKQAWQTSYNIDPNSSIGIESKSFLDQAAAGAQIPVQ